MYMMSDFASWVMGDGWRWWELMRGKAIGCNGKGCLRICILHKRMQQNTYSCARQQVLGSIEEVAEKRRKGWRSICINLTYVTSDHTYIRPYIHTTIYTYIHTYIRPYLSRASASHVRSLVLTSVSKSTLPLFIVLVRNDSHTSNPPFRITFLHDGFRRLSDSAYARNVIRKVCFGHIRRSILFTDAMFSYIGI